MPKCHSPAAERNRDPILTILRRVLPVRGTVLQIASGSGQHDVCFASALPHLTFQPSDIDHACLASIAEHRAEANIANLAKPILLDVLADPWPVTTADAVININMIHISSWNACVALFRGSAQILARDSVLYMYGPYIVEGRELEPSNAAFDQSLRERDPSWGLRRLGEVERVARSAGFRLEETIAMPANNLSLVFRRTIQRMFVLD